MYKNIEKILNTTTTTNGDVCVISTLDKNVDFFGLAGSTTDTEMVVDMFVEAYHENPILALQNLLYVRDIKNGSGMRDNFRACYIELADMDITAAVSLLPIIPRLGRWDDMIALLDSSNHVLLDEILEILKAQLAEDIANYNAGKPISLLAKWMPSENASAKKTKLRARFLIKSLYDGKNRQYRKDLSMLRKYLEIVENRLREHDYTFDYKKLPGKALLKYQGAFERSDNVRYMAFKEDIAKDRTVMTDKVKKLFPYEIARMVRRDKELGNSLWESLPKDISDKKVIVVRDGSGSMLRGPHSATPLEIATSLAIYTSERLCGEFKDKFITFSERPQLVSLAGRESLAAKLQYIERFDDWSITDIMKVYTLLLNASQNVAPCDYLDYVLIISDMQFDAVANSTKSTFDTIKQMFEEAGIPMPKMVYWNVNGDGSGFPTTAENGLFMSGFSTNTLNMLLQGDIENGKQLMVETLARYDSILAECGLFIDEREV